MHGGGAERVASILCNGMDRMGHSVILVPTYSGRGTCVYKLNKSIKLIFLADRVRSTSKSFITKCKRVIALRKLIKETSPDVVISFLTDVNVVTIIASLGLKTKVVVSERSYPPKLPTPLVWKVLRRLTYRFASCVVAQTSLTKEWLDQNCKGSTTTIIPNPVTIPLPIDCPIINPCEILKPNRKLIISVGRLSVEKRHSKLLVAFSKIMNRFPEWDMVILGEGCKRDFLEKKIKSLALESRVYLPGRVGNLGDWYAISDLYALTSSFEGFPNTLLEAMAHGIACVSVDCKTGPSELIQNNVNGILLPNMDVVNNLTEAFNELMGNSHKRAALSLIASQVKEKYHEAKIIKIVE